MVTNITDQLFSSDLNDNVEDEKQHCVYTREEQDLLEKYKEKYMAATSASQRKTIAQLEMLSALFNFWKEKGIVCDKKDTQIKSDVSLMFLLQYIIF